MSPSKKHPAPFSPTRQIPGLTPTFNPKKHTQECQNPPQKKKLPTGPFIDHCNDTYTGGMPLEAHMKRQAQIQMSRRTVRNLKAARAIMLMLRVFLVLGCIGLLVLLISMRNIDMITGWITRVPPAVAGVHALYSIYHYARSSRERTPGSSASYAMFACATDCCLIPFFVLSCLYSHREMGLLNMGDGGKVWVSAIGPPEWINKLVFSVFIMSAASGGIIVVAVLLGLFIAVTYRRIARLPPDLNPLDDRAFVGMIAKADGKRFSQSSIDSIEKEKAPLRQIPFLQTRTTNGSLEWEYSQPLVNKDNEDGINDWERSSRRNTFISEGSKRISIHQRVSSEDQYGTSHRDMGFANNGTMTLGAVADMRTPTMRTTISSNNGSTGAGEQLPRLPPMHRKNNQSVGGGGNNGNAAWWNGHSVNAHPNPKLQNRNTICFANPGLAQQQQQEQMARLQRQSTFDNAGLDRPTRNSHQCPSFATPTSVGNSPIGGNTAGGITRQKTASKQKTKSFTGITARLPLVKPGARAIHDDSDDEPAPRGFYEPLDSTSGDYNNDSDDDENWISHEKDDLDYKFHSDKENGDIPPPVPKHEQKNTYYFDDGDNAEHHHDYIDNSLSAQTHREYGNDDVDIDADVLAHAVNVRMEAMHLPAIAPLNTNKNKVQTIISSINLSDRSSSRSSTPSTPKKNRGSDSANSTPSKGTPSKRKYGILKGSSPKPSPSKNVSPTKVGTRSTSNTGADNGSLPVLNLRLRNVSGSGVV